MTEKDFDNLLSSYLDGDLKEQDLLAFKQMVTEVPTYRHRFQRAVRMHTLMHEVITDQREAKKLGTDESPLDDLAQAHRTPIRKKTRLAKRKPPYGFIFSAAAAIALVGVITLAVVRQSQPEQVGYCIYISGNEGQALIRSEETMPLEENMKLLAGDRIVNHDRGMVMLTLHDGSMISLEQQTELSLPSRPGVAHPQIDLDYGKIMMEVNPVKPGGEPFRISTPDSIMTVLGTMFSVQADQKTTHLNVYEGKVKLARRSDNKEVELVTNTFTKTSDPELNIKAIETPIIEHTTANTIDLEPTDDGYFEYGKWENTQELRVEGGKRDIYLRFAVPRVGKVHKASLFLTQSVDPGKGTLRFFEGSHSDWTDSGRFNKKHAPVKKRLIATRKGAVVVGQTVEVDLSSLVTESGTYTVIVKLDQAGARDIWFCSKEGAYPPRLRLTYE